MEQTNFPRGGRSASGVNPTFTASTASSSSDRRAKQSKLRHSSNQETESISQSELLKKRSSDFLFGGGGDDLERIKTASKRSKTKKDGQAHTASASTKSMLPLGGGAVIQQSGKGKAEVSSNMLTIEALSFNKLAAGMKLLGCVREVHRDLIVYSLPNLWTGYMLLSDFSKRTTTSNQQQQKSVIDDCRKMVQVGQYMTVVIVKAVKETAPSGQQPRRRIQVSCRPDWVNPRAMEDMIVSRNHPSQEIYEKHEMATIAKQNKKKSEKTRSPNALVLSGQVLSVEDHGLLVDLGLGRKGFLKFEDIEGSDYKVVEDEDEDTADTNNEEGDMGTDLLETTTSVETLVLRKGRMLDVMVNQHPASPETRTSILPLALPSRESFRHHLLSFTPTLSNLQPGSLVRAKIEAIAQNGLCVTFGKGAFRGAIHVSQLGGFWIPDGRLPSMDWKSVFETLGVSLTARIIAVDPNTKIIRLSIQPHILQLSPAPALPVVGSVIEKAIVLRTDPGVGALLALPNKTNKEDRDNMMDEADSKLEFNEELYEIESYREASQVRTVYVHISKAMDEGNDETGKTPEALFAKEFAPSTMHDVRILSTSNWVDGIASGATAGSIVTAHVLTHADLVPGKVYRQVPVSAHLNGGAVLVDFGMGVRGLIPAIHLFDQAATNDYRAKMRQVLFALQAKVDVRILSVDAEHKKCTVTAKKSLLKASDIITSFEEVKLGQKATGYISQVDDQGLSVTFFNGVYGRVTARSLAAELGVENHKENYQLGDVVQCRVANIKKRTRSRGRSRFEDADPSDEADDDDHIRKKWELTLSLRVHSTGDDDELQTEVVSESALKSTLRIRAGAVLPLRSLRVAELKKGKEKEKGGFVPGYAIVSVKSKYLLETGCTQAPQYIDCKLPYDQLLDNYQDTDVESAATLDALAEKLLTVGKKINRKGFVLTDPGKSTSDYTSGVGKLPVVSIRPKMVELAEAQAAGGKNDDKSLLLPDHNTHLFMGARLLGYVAHIDERHGTFVHFLNDLSGLLPKTKSGLKFPLFSTICTRIIALDVTTRPIKILLSREKDRKKFESQPDSAAVNFKRGDMISEVQVIKIDFFRAEVKILDSKWKEHSGVRARLHCTMAQSRPLEEPLKPAHEPNTKQIITKCHPFYDLKVGSNIRQLRVVAVDHRDGTCFLELTNKFHESAAKENEMNDLSDWLTKEASQMMPDQKVSGIVSSIDTKKGGLWLQVNPSVSGFVPGFEISEDADVLNNMSLYLPVGCRLDCTVIDKAALLKTRATYHRTRPKKGNQAQKESQKDKDQDRDIPYLSFLRINGKHTVPQKPRRGDLVIGRIQRTLHPLMPPALMLQLRSGFVGRCCITELDEPDEWMNMPLGRYAGGMSLLLDNEIDPENEDGDANPENVEGEGAPSTR